MNTVAAPAMSFSLQPTAAPSHGGVSVHHAAVAPPPVPGLHIRQVTAANYVSELDAIGSLLARYPFIAVDTEYPGTVHGPPAGSLALTALSPAKRYALVKANVDAVPVLQLGITLCDEFGNVPAVRGSDGRPQELAWEVTFSDFDARREDPHAPESVAFLRSQGFDFDHARARGVSSAAFAAKLAAVLSSAATTMGRRDGLTWAAFGGAYDFAYLVKMLAGGGPLPDTWHEFIAQARDLLGGRVFDAKYMAEHCDERPDLFGGLRRVAARLHVQRPPNSAGSPYHLAGRKSHIAGGIYTAMRRRVIYRDGGACLEGFIDGLH